MFSCFQSAYTKEKLHSHHSQLWWDLLTQLNDVLPEKTPFKEPDTKISKVCYTIVRHKIFEALVFVIILSNLVVMTLMYETAPNSYSESVELLNVAFTIIFIVECILKLIAYGIKEYFRETWNKFDFIVVCTGVIEILISFSYIDILHFNGLFKILQVLRILRILRVIR